MKWTWLILLFIVLKLIALSSSPIFLWDESVYIGMGKYIWSSEESGLFEPFRPMLLPLALGGLWRLGIGDVGYKVFMILITGLLIYFTYRVAGHYLKRKELGLLILFSPLLFHMADAVMTSVVCALMGVIALDRYHAKQYLLSGVSLGLAFGVRYPAGLMFAALIFGLMYMKEWDALIKVILGFSITFIGYCLFVMHFGAGLESIAEAAWHAGNAAHGVEGSLYNLFFYPVQLFRDNVLMVLIIPGMWLLWKEKKVPVVFLGIIPLLYFTSIVNKQPRFMLMFLPFCAIMAGRGAEWMLERKVHRTILWLLVAVMLCTTAIADVWHMQYHVERDIEEFYRYFEDVDGTVLTADPIASVYADNKFIPLYFSYREIEDLYRTGIGQADYIMWTSAGFSCPSYGEKCFANVALVQEKVYRHKMLFNATYDGFEHAIFSVDRR